VLGKRSMELMAEQVMPRVNAAIGTTTSATRTAKGVDAPMRAEVGS